MSRTMKRTTEVEKKPYCKVCFDAGKSESEYTSHWVKSLPDRTGKTIVTCPTLLNQNCRFCNENGHTVKFCKALAKQTKENERASKKNVVEKKPICNAKKVIKPVNAFAMLCEESDSEAELCDEKAEELVEEQVELPKTNNWAAIAAKPAFVKPVEVPAKRTGLVLLSDFIEKPEPEKVVKKAPWAEKSVAKSWADCSESEDDDDEEDETW